MRPVRLAIRRFLGIESVTIDFHSRLFVVVGPNGAGKSSILEALYYALFGKGIRTERGKKELLHRGYPADSLRVELEFDLADSGYRVTREYSPKRGSAAVLEHRHNGGWEPVCSGEQSVNTEIGRLTGLDGETFRSSVFLPQGETLAFVEATPARRFKILSTLFGLDMLDRVRERVKERLDRLEGTLAPALERRETLVQENLAEVLGRRLVDLQGLRQKASVLEQETRMGEEKVNDLGWLQEIHQTGLNNREKITILFQQRREADHKAELDRKITHAQSVAAGTYPLWQAVKEAVGQVEAEVEDRQRKRLDCHAKTEIVDRAIRETAVQEKATAEQLERLVRYRDRLDQDGRPLAGELDRLNDRLSVLEAERVRLVQEEQVLLETEQRETLERDRVAARLGAVQTTFNQRKHILDRLAGMIQQAEPLQQQLDVLQQDIGQTREDVRNTEKELSTYQAEVTELTRFLETSNRERDALRLEKESRESVHRDEVRRFAIHELYEQWAETGVCPVCQSQTTPSPAVRENGEPEQMIVQEQRYRAFQERLTALETECAKLVSRRESELERLRETSVRLQMLGKQEHALVHNRREIDRKMADIFQALPDIEAMSWTAMVERVNRERETLENNAEEITSLEIGLTVREEKLRGIGERYRGLVSRRDEAVREQGKLIALKQTRETKLGEVLAEMRLSQDQYPSASEAFHDYWNRCRKVHEDKNQEYTRLSSELVRLREQLIGLKHRRTELDNEIQVLESRLVRLRTDKRDKKGAFLKDLEVYGFDLTTFLHLKDCTVGGWQERLIKLSGEIEQLSGAVAENEQQLMAGAARWRVAPEQLEAAYREAKHRLDQVRRETGDIREQSGALNQEIDQIRRKQDELNMVEHTIRQVTEERETHRRLKEALEVRGFKNYLLGMLLKELEKESTDFLWSLSEGRYRLSVNMTGGETEIVVLDERLGAQGRYPSECSGGEKTLIALSFSLALSRIRRRESGARGEAACLFIDEGFSPLDRDHLGLVADAIIRLGCDGKMVGVVTHDPLFADLFPVHLEVGGGNAAWKENQTVG